MNNMNQNIQLKPAVHKGSWTTY